MSTDTSFQSRSEIDMRPAFSVLLFTTLSGMGYGLLFWLGLRYAWRPLPLSAEFALILFWLGLGLVTAGLVASVFHLGKPLRAWRAFSQWRTSWLSREGVLALLTYVPALTLMALIDSGRLGIGSQLAGALLALLSLGTVSATAMIYASLRTVPAWRHPTVVPAYLGFALLGGGGWLLALLSLTGWRPPSAVLFFALGLVLALLVLKLAHWRAIDKPLPASRASALGLPDDRDVAVFEAPHTEASFITHEMLFAFARRRALALQVLAVALFVGLPLWPLTLVLMGQGVGPLPWLAATGGVWLGSLVERWLFFAQARHVVSHYY
jgi:DMSO reductase anchor subunit